VSVVVDASAALDIALGRQSRLAMLLVGEDLHVPMTFDVEVPSALRRLELAKLLTTKQVEEVRRNVSSISMSRHPLVPHLIDTCWPWRHDITIQDGVYVALARLLGAGLMTTDDRLARAAKTLVTVL
jgi:predicted nucleic acid-binding protein